MATQKDSVGKKVLDFAIILGAVAVGAAGMWFWDDQNFKNNQNLVEKELLENFTQTKVDLHKVGIHGVFLDNPLYNHTHNHDDPNHEEDDVPLTPAQEKEMDAADAKSVALFSTPGGAYTAEDIKKNGTRTPWERFSKVIFAYNLRPFPGQPIDPISGTKIHHAFDWMVGGKPYHFCSVPTLEEFVMRAKNDPSSIKPPEAYIQPGEPHHHHDGE